MELRELNRNELYRQLGANRFCAMTGAVFYGSGPTTKKQTITFKGSRKANMLNITLNSADLYDLEFFTYSTRNGETNTVKIEDVAGDQLQEVFTQRTGLYCSL